jgi:hypothetical protein
MLRLKLDRLPHCVAADRAFMYLPPARGLDAETQELADDHP